MLLSHLLDESNSNFLDKFSLFVLPDVFQIIHFKCFNAIKYLLSAAKINTFQCNIMASFLEVAKFKMFSSKTILSCLKIVKLCIFND